MKGLFIAFTWLLLASGVMLGGIGGYLYGQNNKQPLSPYVTETATHSQAWILNKNIDPDVKGIQTTFETEDGRSEIVANFLARYNSPLAPHDHFGQVFVDLADKHGFDFRLLPAIAMQESNLCKVIPEGSYNCLGFGVHSRGTLKFESYEANFDRAARELKANYIDIGLTTPEQIMTKYTPSSDGSWANSVNQWMAEMKYDDREKGRELKTDASVLEFVQSDSSTEN